MKYIQLIRLEIYFQDAVCNISAIFLDADDFAANDVVNA